jgi:hypothetical protein
VAAAVKAVVISANPLTKTVSTRSTHRSSDRDRL